MGAIKEQRALGACLERTTRRVLKVTSPTPPGSNERGALSCLLEVVVRLEHFHRDQKRV